MEEQSAYDRIKAALDAQQREQQPLADDIVRINHVEDGIPSESGGRTYQRSSIVVDKSLRGAGRLIHPTRGA
jgi:hypothetical protein